MERESHVADEALLLSFGPRNLLTHIDGGGSLLGEPPNVLSAVWVHTIPGQAKTTLATALELLGNQQTQDKFNDPTYKGISVFCSVTSADLSEFYPMPPKADYLVLPIVPAAGETELRIGHENACSDSHRLVVHRLPSVEYPTGGVSRTFTLLPPCHSLTPTDTPSVRELVRQPSLWYNILYTCTTPQGHRQPAMNRVDTSQDEIVAGGILYTSQTIPAPWPRVEPPNLGADTGIVEAKDSSSVDPKHKSPRAQKTRCKFFSDESEDEAEEGDDTNDEIHHLASQAASSSQRQEADFIPGTELNPNTPGSATGGGILARAGMNTNLSVITGEGVEMQYFGSTGSSRTEASIGTQIGTSTGTQRDTNIATQIEEIIREQTFRRWRGRSSTLVLRRCFRPEAGLTSSSRASIPW